MYRISAVRTSTWIEFCVFSYFLKLVLVLVVHVSGSRFFLVQLYFVFVLQLLGVRVLWWVRHKIIPEYSSNFEEADDLPRPNGSEKQELKNIRNTEGHFFRGISNDVRPTQSNMVKYITSMDEFNAILETSKTKPVIIDFTATWWVTIQLRCTYRI